MGYLAGAVKENTSWDVMVYNADFIKSSEPWSIRYLTGDGFNNFLQSVNEMNSEIWEEVKSVIVEYKPAVIALTSMTQNFICANIIAGIAKNISRDIHVILGGSHSTLLKSEVLEKNKDIDISVVGEGDETIIELLTAIENQETLENIKGIIYRKEGECYATSKRDLISDINKLPFPYKYANQVLKDFKDYPTHAFQNIFSIRGCPYNCVFCGSRYLWGRRPRFRSIENIMSEIDMLVEAGIQSIIFEDDTFGIKESFILEICANIKNRYPNLEWSCEMHVNIINEKVIVAMKESGCRRIIIGIESGNNEILEKVRKQTTIEACYVASKIIKKHDIYLNGFFMVGFPWETEKTLYDTLKAIKKINCFQSGYSIFTPYKGTDAFEICKKMGTINDDYNYSLYHHQSPLNCFCLIPHAKFRKICSKIEKTIDRQNKYNRIIDLFSFALLFKIKKYGIRNSIRTFFKIIGL